MRPFPPPGSGRRASRRASSARARGGPGRTTRVASPRSTRVSRSRAWAISECTAALPSLRERTSRRVKRRRTPCAAGAAEKHPAGRGCASREEGRARVPLERRSLAASCNYPSRLPASPIRRITAPAPQRGHACQCPSSDPATRSSLFCLRGEPALSLLPLLRPGRASERVVSPAERVQPPPSSLPPCSRHELAARAVLAEESHLARLLHRPPNRSRQSPPSPPLYAALPSRASSRVSRRIRGAPSHISKEDDSLNLCLSLLSRSSLVYSVSLCRPTCLLVGLSVDDTPPAPRERPRRQLSSPRLDAAFASLRASTVVDSELARPHKPAPFGLAWGRRRRRRGGSPVRWGVLVSVPPARAVPLRIVALEVA